MGNQVAGNRSKILAPVIVAGVFIVLGFVGYLSLQGQHKKAQVALQKAATEEIVDLSLDLTRTLATTIADDAARLEHAMLDAQLATVVRGRRVTGVQVLNQDGQVVATTDQRQAGRVSEDDATLAALKVGEVTLMDARPAPGQVEVSAPLFLGPERVGTVRVFFDLGDLAPLPSTR